MICFLPFKRVMPTSFFVLARFCLRVDNVLFRLFDTRLYHSFDSSPPIIVRETSGWEASYKSVKAVSDTRHLLSQECSPFCPLHTTVLVVLTLPRPDAARRPGFRVSSLDISAVREPELRPGWWHGLACNRDQSGSIGTALVIRRLT